MSSKKPDTQNLEVIRYEVVSSGDRAAGVPEVRIPVGENLAFSDLEEKQQFEVKLLERYEHIVDTPYLVEVFICKRCGRELTVERMCDCEIVDEHDNKSDSLNLTDLEKQVLTNIVNSEFMDAENIDQTEHWGVWSFSVTNETNQLKGALGSLVKKQYCFAEKHEGEDEVCGLTNKGVQVVKTLNLCQI